MPVIMQINFMDKKLILLFVFATTIVTSHSQPFYGWTADATTIAENNFEIKAKGTTVDFHGNVYTPLLVLVCSLNSLRKIKIIGKL
jgi:hypothetical protein